MSSTENREDEYFDITDYPTGVCRIYFDETEVSLYDEDDDTVSEISNKLLKRLRTDAFKSNLLGRLYDANIDLTSQGAIECTQAHLDVSDPRFEVSDDREIVYIDIAILDNITAVTNHDIGIGQYLDVVHDNAMTPEIQEIVMKSVMAEIKTNNLSSRILTSTNGSSENNISPFTKMSVTYGDKLYGLCDVSTAPGRDNLYIFYDIYQTVKLSEVLQRNMTNVEQQTEMSQDVDLISSHDEHTDDMKYE